MDKLTSLYLSPSSSISLTYMLTIHVIISLGQGSDLCADLSTENYLIFCTLSITKKK